MGLSEPGLIKQLPRSVLSWDVIGVLVYLSLVVPLQLVPLPSGIRFVLVAPILLFLPGYALTTVLFPGRPSEAGGIGAYAKVNTNTGSVPRLDLVERAALSVGLSVALLPLFAFAFAATIGTVTGPIVIVASVFSVFLALLGGVRRSRLPEADRFTVPIDRWYNEAVGLVTNESSHTVAINVALVASVLLAMGVVGMAVAVPQQGETFTEFAVGTEQDEEFLIANYPTDLTVDDTAELSLLVENHEGEPIEYQVVAQFERVEGGGVTETEDAGTFALAVDPGETAIETHTASPSMTGDDIRLTFLLYVGEPPADPDRETAYRSTHVWMNVEPTTDD